MSKRYTTKIANSYVSLRTIYIGSDAIKKGGLKYGKIRVLIDSDEDFSVEGTLNSQGGLSGMTKLYQRLNIKAGDSVEFEVTSENEILIISPSSKSQRTRTSSKVEYKKPLVFQSKKLNHVHIEAFRPENLNNWEPETETDIYLAFGVLETFTDYQYCCGVSQALLKKLGANYSATAKPDAILIDRRNDRYLMAEWKKRSSDFKSNHKPADIDILVCWHDDESDRSTLPQIVVCLHSIARQAAEVALLGE